MRPKANYSLLELGLLRWRWIGLWTAGFVLLAGVVTLLIPKKYGSEVQFLVKNARQELTLTPERSAVPVTEQELTEADVNSEMELLLSHDLLMDVVRDSALYRPYMKRGQQSPTAEDLELATIRLAKNLKVSAVRKTNVIEAKYRAHSPEEAAQVMQDLSTRYLQAHLTAHSTPGSVNFFSSEMKSYRDNLYKTEAEASAFEQSSHIFNPDQQRTLLVAQLEDVRARLQNGRADTAEAQARLKTLQSQIAATPGRIPTDERTSANPATVDHLQTALADMENRRISMLMKFRPDDREVVELESEMANTKAELLSAKAEFSSENTTAINIVHQSLEENLEAAQVQLTGLQARSAALAALQSDYLAKLDAFDTQATKLGNLQRDESLAQQSYVLYGQRMEEAQVAHEMDKENFTNVSMIETPMASPLAVWPILPLDLAVGALFGLLIGFTTAYIWPSSDPLATSTQPSSTYFNGKDLTPQVAGD